MLPTTAQYAAANRAAGAQKAAYELFTRLVTIDAPQDCLLIAEAFCKEMNEQVRQAYEPMFNHVENLPTLTDDEAPRYQVVGEVYTVKAA